ncbi:hypothetical protein WJX79_008488 [Trebouxia sp. C0005]
MLAKQVHADFEWISKAYQLSTLCLYGGSPYQPQESALRRGIDIVVGTQAGSRTIFKEILSNSMSYSFACWMNVMKC